MKRENVLVSEDALARQREFEAKIKEMFTAREAHPVACVDTFGCQQNVADGQKLMGMLADCGFTFTEDPKEADLVILNTCAVREHAEQRVFGNLGILTHTKKENPEQVICLCGCMAGGAGLSAGEGIQPPCGSGVRPPCPVEISGAFVAGLRDPEAGLCRGQ